MTDVFLIYRSFIEAIRELSPEDQLNAYNAIMDYALDGKEPDMKGPAMAVFLMARPQIDANTKRREAGKAGAAKTNSKAEERQTVGTASANLRQDVGNPSASERQPVGNPSATRRQDVGIAEPLPDKVKVKVNKESNKEKINKEKDALDARGYTGELRGAVERWLEYRRKIRKPYADLEGFLDKIDEDRKAHGDAYVVEEVAYSIQQGYQGLFAEKKPVARSGTTNFSNERKFDPSIEALLLGEA